MTYTVHTTLRREDAYADPDPELSKEDTFFAYIGAQVSSAAWGDHGAGLAMEQAGLHEEFMRAMDAAVAAVGHQIEAIGQKWRTLALTIVGHVNPGNAQAQGWANDFLQVSLTVLDYDA